MSWCLTKRKLLRSRWVCLHFLTARLFPEEKLALRSIRCLQAILTAMVPVVFCRITRVLFFFQIMFHPQVMTDLPTQWPRSLLPRQSMWVPPSFCGRVFVSDPLFRLSLGFSSRHHSITRIAAHWKATCSQPFFLRPQSWLKDSSFLD